MKKLVTILALAAASITSISAEPTVEPNNSSTTMAEYCWVYASAISVETGLDPRTLWFKCMGLDAGLLLAG